MPAVRRSEECLRNKAGLPLPAELTSEPAGEHLSGEAEMAAREDRMKGVCSGCHSGQWVDGLFRRFDRTIETTNRATLTATQLITSAWEQGLARGPAPGDSLFNEAVERMWVADYGVFANGRWVLSHNIQKMKDWIEFKLGGKTDADFVAHSKSTRGGAQDVLRGLVRSAPVMPESPSLTDAPRQALFARTTA